MHRDPTLRKRNALVIPGVLLVLVCLAGIVYAQALRADDGECGDGKQVVFANACRSATLLLAIPLALGVLLLGLGIAVRRRDSCNLGHGTCATTVLAVLVAAALLPLLAALGLYLTEDPDAPYAFTVGDVEYGGIRLLAGLGLLMLLVLLPYLGLYIGTGRPPRCCREKGCFEPCYCDESEAAPPVPTFPLATATTTTTTVASTTPTADNAQVTSSRWTGANRAVQPLGAPAPSADSTPPPPVPEPATPATLPHDSWPLPANPPPPEPAPALVPDEPAATEGKEPKKAPARKPAKKTRKVTRKKSK